MVVRESQRTANQYFVFLKTYYGKCIASSLYLLKRFAKITITMRPPFKTKTVISILVHFYIDFRQKYSSIIKLAYE